MKVVIHLRRQFEFDQRQDVTYTFDWGDGQTETFRATSTNPNQLITHDFENLSAFVDASFMVTLTVTQPELVSPAFCSVTADTIITIFNDIIVEVSPASTEILWRRNDNLGKFNKRSNGRILVIKECR